MSVVDALLSIAAGDRRAVMVSCGAVADSSRLAIHLRSALAQPGGGEVYVDPAAFDRFISWGSNVGLYAATIDALSELNRRREPTTLLDIGCGDGRVTAATLPASCRQVSLLEPSVVMLASAIERIGRAGLTVEVESRSATVQELLATEPDRRWDAVQSTFALHNLRPSDRHDVLASLASRTESIAVVEFDVPHFADHSREHAVYAAEAYESGVAEYADDPIVIEGFLMPVLIGQFAPDQPRHTYEQPAEAWAEGFRRAGFRSVTTTRVAGFWWADAWLVHGTDPGPDPSSR